MGVPRLPGETAPSRSWLLPTPTSASPKGGLRVEKATRTDRGSQGQDQPPGDSARRRPLPAWRVSPGPPPGRAPAGLRLGPSRRCPAACGRLGRAGRAGPGGPGRRCEAGVPRPHAAARDSAGRAARAAERLAVGDGLRCPRPGQAPSRAAADTAMRPPVPAACEGRRTRPAPAAAVSELPGPRATDPEHPGPWGRDAGLAALPHLSRHRPAARVVGQPQLGETCPNLGAL